MPKQKQQCPECAAFALTCEKTGPTEFVGHDLQNPRASLWRCAVCGARFELLTPASTLRRIKRGAISPEICQRVLNFLGLSVNPP